MPRHFADLPLTIGRSVSPHLSSLSPQIVLTPDSPLPPRRVLPPVSPPLPCRPPMEEPKVPLLAQQTAVPVPPPPPPPPQPSHVKEAASPHIIQAPPSPALPLDSLTPNPGSSPPVLKSPNQPTPAEPVPPVVPKVLVSVGCQTDYDPVFPPMQAGPASTSSSSLYFLSSLYLSVFMFVWCSGSSNTLPSCPVSDHGSGERHRHHWSHAGQQAGQHAG